MISVYLLLDYIVLVAILVDAVVDVKSQPRSHPSIDTCYGITRHITVNFPFHCSVLEISLQWNGKQTVARRIFVRRKREFSSKRTEVFLGKDWSPLRNGLTLNQHIHNVNIARYSGQEKNEAINDFSRLGYQTLTAGIVSTSQWALIAPNGPVVIAIYCLLLLIIDNQYHIITQNSGFEA